MEAPEPEEPEPRDEIDESLLERAVRAGMTMKEARDFGSPETLESVVGRLERSAKSETGAPDGGDGENGGKPDAGGDGDVEIPDLDPEEWDEKLVGALKAMKAKIALQDAEIRRLRSAGESAREESWVEGQFRGMDDGRRAALGIGDSSPTKEQSAARERVMSKFKVLEAGYAATGAKIDRAAILDEAVTSVVGATPPKRDRRAELERRNASFVARPSHERAAPKREGDSIDDLKASVASSLSKFYQ